MCLSSWLPSLKKKAIFYFPGGLSFIIYGGICLIILYLYKSRGPTQHKGTSELNTDDIALLCRRAWDDLSPEVKKDASDQTSLLLPGDTQGDKKSHN